MMVIAWQRYIHISGQAPAVVKAGPWDIQSWRRSIAVQFGGKMQLSHSLRPAMTVSLLTQACVSILLQGIRCCKVITMYMDSVVSTGINDLVFSKEAHKGDSVWKMASMG